MTPRTAVVRDRRRFDALIDQPLRAFRAEIERMTSADLEALQARLETRLIGVQFTRSAHGMARHLAAQERPLLERRLALVGALRAQPRVHQLQLVEPAVLPGRDVTASFASELDEQVAA